MVIDPVNAIDPTFHPGEAGLMIHWGNGQSDKDILYQSSQQNYHVTDETNVVFSFTNQGITVEKHFRFYPDKYRVDFEVHIRNHSGQNLSFNRTDGFYDVNWVGGFGFPSFRDDSLNNLLIQQEGDLTILPVAKLMQEVKSQPASYLPTYTDPTIPVVGQVVGWVGVGQKYFLSAIIPNTPTETALKGFSHAEQVHRTIIKPNSGVRMDMATLRDQTPHVDSFTLYVGPMDEENLETAEASLEDAQQVFLKSVVGPIAYLMLKLLQGLYLIIPNYGFAIILLTFIVKLLMFPIYHKQMISMKKMQQLQPQMNALKEQYKNDPQKLQKEQMELFRKHKEVNPLAGCLPLFVMMPIFIALYATFSMAVELQGAEFIWWINDLSTADRAFFIPIGSYIFRLISCHWRMLC